MKLYDNKKIALMVISAIIGMGIFFFRQFSIKGSITPLEIGCGIFALLTAFILFALVVRHAHKDD